MKTSDKVDVKKVLRRTSQVYSILEDLSVEETVVVLQEAMRMCSIQTMLKADTENAVTGLFNAETAKNLN